MNWVVWFVALLLLSACATRPPDITNTDSFCLVYERVIQSKGDGSIQAPLDVKRRILTNEKLYQELCTQKPKP